MSSKMQIDSKEDVSIDELKLGELEFPEESLNAMNNVQMRQRSYMKDEYEGICVIENFRKIECPAGQFVQYSTFFTGKHDEFKWGLSVYPHGYDEDSKYISIRFDLLNESVENSCDYLIGSRFIASIIDKDGKKYSTRSAFTEKYLTKYFAIMENFIRWDDLFFNKFRILPKDAMTIALKVTFDIPEQDYTQRTNESTTLGKVFDAGKYTDFKLIVGKKEFNVHRAILAAQSPVFEAMFDSDMNEKKEGTAKIDDVEEKVMEKLLNFVYVGKMENFKEFANKIFIAANKYQIDDLNRLCENVLVKQLSVDNVYDTLRFADENNAEYLQEKAIEFFHRNVETLSASTVFKYSLNMLPGNLKTDIICVLINKPT